MQRRTFLTTTAGLLAATAAQALLPPHARAITLTREQAWAPNPSGSPFLAVEWRYIAGRITINTEDYGFVISITDHRLPSPFQELLVERQDLKTGAFVGKNYVGSISYTANTTTYLFQDTSKQVSATLQLEANTPLYRLTLNAPELPLQNIVLRPKGNLIPETGDGFLSVGQVQGLQVDSDYYADWTEIESGGNVVGVARVDMQGLRLASPAARAPAATSTDYDHHWFALAGTLGSEPVWVSAWRIETDGGPLWDVTIARGTGNWTTTFKTEADTMAEPLTVRVLAFQPVGALLGSGGPSQTGSSWHVSAGVAQPGDLLDLTITVPPGQFASSARIGGNNTTGFLEEGVGVSAAGTVQGQQLSGVRLAVAETSAEFALAYLPFLRR